MAATITLDGQELQFEEGMSATEHFTDHKDVIAVRINGVARDLGTELNAGDKVEPIRITEPDGLNILRHSCAHVIAQAVQDLYPGTKLGIGPYITDGFYYDFQVDTPFTPEDLKAIEKKAQRIVKEGQTFHRVVVSKEEAIAREANEPFKLELIEDKGQGAEGASVEVGGGELTVYENRTRTGEVVWQDLCQIGRAHV